MVGTSPDTSTLESTRTSGSSAVLVKSPPPESPAKRDANLFLVLGALQIILGMLMCLLGVGTLMLAASMASSGAGLWGGGVAMVTGCLGLLVGSRLTTGQMAVTALLAMSLVCLAVTNLAVVLAGTGLVRESTRQVVEWPPLLANAGLLVACLGQCLAVLVCGYRCSRQVCTCANTSSRHAAAATATSGDHVTTGKDQLIANWLQVQQPARRQNYLLVPRAAIQGHFSPIYTLPAPPMGTSCGHYSPPVSCHDYRPLSAMQKRYGIQHSPRHKPQRRSEPRRKQRPITDEEVARTYTGLDRLVAEQFIDSAMTPSPTTQKD